MGSRTAIALLFLVLLAGDRLVATQQSFVGQWSCYARVMYSTSVYAAFVFSMKRFKCTVDSLCWLR